MMFPAPLFGFIATLAAWIGLSTDSDPAQREAVQRMIVHDEVLIHVPIWQRAQPLIEWVERKGPKCLPGAALAGAAMAGPSSVDFVLRDRRRVRAELDSDCAGLDFYGGFYVEPRDGAICARRDEIRSRVGGSCRIQRFRALVPVLKRP